MIILSIDVGIKNMAYCIFDVQSNESYCIKDWDIINLLKIPNRCSWANKKKKCPIHSAELNPLR